MYMCIGSRICKCFFAESNFVGLRARPTWGLPYSQREIITACTFECQSKYFRNYEEFGNPIKVPSFSILAASYFVDVRQYFQSEEASDFNLHECMIAKLIQKCCEV
jgi:hypothetical protein